MAHQHGNGFFNCQLLNIQYQKSFNSNQTVRLSDISGSGIDSPQDCHLDTSYQLQRDLSLFRNPNSSETECFYPEDWYTNAIDSHGQMTFPSKIDTSANSVNRYISEDELMCPESAASIVESVISTGIVSHDPPPWARNNDLSTEQSGPIEAYPGRAAKSRKHKRTTAKCLTQVERHSRILERNRVAALKCRQKKKEWTTRLEEKARGLQQKRNILCQSVSSMKDELLCLKGEILRHSGCHNPEIRVYLDLEAGRLAGTISTYPYHTSDLDDVLLRTQTASW